MFQALQKRTGKRMTETSTSQPSSDTIEFADGDSLVLGGNRRVDETGQRGFRLDDGPVVLEGGADLLGLEAYTVMISFRQDTEDDGGALVTFDGSFSLSVSGPTLLARIETSSGARRLNAGKLPITTGTWHRVALTFSGATGKAALYLDGTEVDAVGDLNGARQAGNLMADLLVGTDRGRSFSGRLDQFKLIDAALGGDDLARA